MNDQPLYMKFSPWDAKFFHAKKTEKYYLWEEESKPMNQASDREHLFPGSDSPKGLPYS